MNTVLRCLYSSVFVWLCVNTTSVAQSQLANSTIRFQDITESSQLLFKHQDGSDGNRYLVELMGAGICSFDADCDGLVDVFMLNGYELSRSGKRKPMTCNRASCLEIVAHSSLRLFDGERHLG